MFVLWDVFISLHFAIENSPASFSPYLIVPQVLFTMQRQFSICAVLLAIACVGCARSGAYSSEPDIPQSSSEITSNTLPDLGGMPILVGSDTTYPPFGFVSADNEILGFDVDLMDSVCGLLNCQPTFQTTSFDGIFTALAADEFDILASAITITSERAEIVDFTRPYLQAGQIVTVQIGSDIVGPESLNEKEIGVQLGTTGDLVASDYSSQVVRYETIDLAMQALAQGDIDAVVTDAPTAADIIHQQFETELEMVGEPFTSEYYGIAVSPGNEELLDALSQAIAVLESEGELAEIAEKWSLPEVSVSDLPATGL